MGKEAKRWQATDWPNLLAFRVNQHNTDFLALPDVEHVLVGTHVVPGGLRGLHLERNLSA